MTETRLGAQVVLRRNFGDQPFVSTMLDADKVACTQRISKALDALQSRWTFYPVRELSKGDLAPLAARNMLTEQVWKTPEAGLFVREDQLALVLSNVEDHVQVRVAVQGDAQEEAIREAKSIMAHIGEEWPFAQDEQLGWLTARPVLAGSGTQIVTHLHLPMLSMMQQIRGITRTLGDKQLFELSNAPGQDDKNPGALYALSSMFNAYGGTAKLAEAAENQTQEIEKREENLRSKILGRAIRSTYVDQVWRAYGTLKYARRLTEQEFLGLWSKLRLGVLAGLIPVPIETVNNLLEKASRTALHELMDGTRDEHALHFIRADVVRAELDGGQ